MVAERPGRGSQDDGVTKAESPKLPYWPSFGHFISPAFDRGAPTACAPQDTILSGGFARRGPQSIHQLRHTGKRLPGVKHAVQTTGPNGLENL